jgi:E1A/CREB-binding protein
VIRLQQSSDTDLQDIKDPDPLMNCDLMDGRDAFLTLSRDKHYEFSSLRRAKYSSVGLLYELHTQARDNFIYNCNACKASVETRYHCPTCDVSYLMLTIHFQFFNMI